MLNGLNIEEIKSLRDTTTAKEFLFSHIEFNETLCHALDFATDAHSLQQRKSGEAYIIHPILVASIVAYISNDESMVIAALLHDVVEDTEHTIENVESMYGKDVAHLVEGLTKIDTIRDVELVSANSNEKLITSALTFRKMLLASVEDVRVLVIKLCDRLHNMLTLDALSPEKQLRISEETLVVYSPIAHRLGISFLKNLLEDLSFKYLFSKEKTYIESELKENYQAIEIRLNTFRAEVEKLLLRNGFSEDEFKIVSRVKHLYSIYLKMQRKGVSLDEVLDLLAVRILLKDELQCYKVLGLIHTHFRPLASRFKDYIAVAKENGYQTLHTTIFASKSVFEVQIRTFEMHETAELGVAAHWKYKGDADRNVNLDWLHNLQYQNESVENFYELVKNDLYSEDISIFSPKGNVYTLPRGAVVLDFAYAVHTEVGNCAKGALVNKEKRSLLDQLHDGDIVNIETSKELITRCSWIDAVKTSRAKTNMKLNCNQRLKSIDTTTAKNIISTIMDLKQSRIEEWCELQQCKDLSKTAVELANLKELIHRYVADIKQNSRFERFLANHKFKVKTYTFNNLQISSNRNVSNAVFDYCCHPKGGDEIVSFLEKNVAHVHHKMCTTALKMMDDNLPMLFVNWLRVKKFHYNLIISLQNSKGALAKLLTHLAKIDLDIISIELGKDKTDYIHYCEIEFESVEADLNKIKGKIEKNFKIIELIRSDDAYKTL
ncbi:MAG: RelA/SpoT family protein [Helicobacteraceae bacterium]|nr:RelA/SpoT family protein [Helicobacteraceae bacterium]